MWRPVLSCVLTASLAAIACGNDKQVNARTVVIGASIDRTGSIARPAWHEAVRLAVADANAGISTYGSYSGLKFALQAADSTNTPAVAVARAIELVQQMGAKMLITDTSADAIAVNQLNYDTDTANDLNVPMVCQACTSGSINNPDATDADPSKQAALRNEKQWMFRSTMVSSPQGLVLLRLTTVINMGDVNTDGVFKITVYNIDDSYGNGFFNDILAAISTLAISPAPIVEKITHQRDIDASNHNWAADAAKMADNYNETTATTDGYPDVVIIVDFPQYAAAITEAYKVGGYTPRVLQTHNFRHDTVIIALGADVNGQEGTSHAILDNGDSGVVFNNGLRDLTGVEAGFWDANTYDAAFTLLLACAKAVKTNSLSDPSQVTGAQIRDEMLNLNDKSVNAMRIDTGSSEFAKALGAFEAGAPIDYFGASGPMDYTNGNVRGKIARFVYEQGAFRDKDLFDCIADPMCPKIN